MVTHYTGRPSRRTRGGGVCIDCGTRYLFTNTYKGNYCTDCHESWVERRSTPSPSGRPARFGSARPEPSDRPDALEEPYDAE